ncbi:MAG: hypothetical protein NZ805_13035 [Armatimonadetes bacterium]|nr:hypothetical protein [Armatimonadota bacterium]
MSLKPVGSHPVVCIRVFGPYTRVPYPPPRPRQVAFKELKDEVKVTIQPGQIYTILDWEWDLKDLETGETVPFGGRYLMVIEVCGLVEVNGQDVGVIETPLKVFGHKFDIAKPPEPIHIDLTGGSPPPPPSSGSPPKPPSPPNW